LMIMGIKRSKYFHANLKIDVMGFLYYKNYQFHYYKLKIFFENKQG